MRICTDLFKGNSDSIQRAAYTHREQQCLPTGKYSLRFWFATLGKNWRQASTCHSTKSSRQQKEEVTNISITSLAESRSYAGTWRWATYSSTILQSATRGPAIRAWKFDEEFFNEWLKNYLPLCCLSEFLCS